MSARPRIGEDIVLAIGEGEQLRVRVVGKSAGVLDLDLVESPQTLVSEMLGAPVSVEYVGEDGVVRLDGELARGAGPHLVCFAPAGRPRLLQRRHVARATVARPLVLLALEVPDAVPISARTVEVGGDGLTVRGIRAPTVGAVYRFELELARGEPAIVGEFRVSAVQDAAAVVSFTVLADHDRARLERYASDASRRKVG